ncbi:hypothetical protein IHC93_07570 [Photobacterium damselae subsp. damselae]|uniref:hypothetical protein n=1 Tax=Photobacterium damselae TaxID=38293 RepID=UPI001F451429|nr:hypothetical protein [Photobacterium damselae]UKA26695.1 hypothetical protein IHC93_07570 [Photobacterium damselae subsp. damselae]
MGLEQQISSLVQASENLTGAVNNKIGEIDKEVDDAIDKFQKSFPAQFERHTKRSININPLSGIDAPNQTTYRSIKYALQDNSFVQALNVYLQGDVTFDGSYLVTNRYLSINLNGHVLKRTSYTAMFNGEYNAFVKIFNGVLCFKLSQPELVAPNNGVCPFFYTVDTVMTLLLGDRDGWKGADYIGGLRIQSNCSHLISAVGSHVEYRAHSCRFELIGDNASCQVIHAASGGSIEQYESYNVVADSGFNWNYVKA